MTCISLPSALSGERAPIAPGGPARGPEYISGRQWTRPQLQGAAQKNAREEELKKLKTELEKQTIVLADDARKAKEQNFMQKRKELDRFLKDAQEDMQAKNDELTNRIVDGIVKIIQEYGRKNGYTIVFVKNEGMIYVDEKADLTEEVIKTFNAARSK